jgi:hypothetical protein
MAAGLGFKTFNTGEVLTAGDVNGYLMQGVLVFASAAARDAAITSPQEGQFAYLKDTNVTTYYTGSAWANLDTTGMVNPMTTTGDTIYSSSGSTPARLGIGTTGQVLTVSGGVPTWATAAAGGGTDWSLLNAGGTALTGAQTVTVSGISGKDKIMVIVEFASSASANSGIKVRLNTDTASNYYAYGQRLIVQSTYASNVFGVEASSADGITVGQMSLAVGTGSEVSGYVLLSGCNSSGVKAFNSAGGGSPSGSDGNRFYTLGGYYNSASTISSVSVASTVGNLDAGTVYVYASA